MSVSQRVAITSGRSQVTSVSDCGYRSRGKTWPRRVAGEGRGKVGWSRATGHAKIFNPLRALRPSELVS